MKQLKKILVLSILIPSFVLACGNNDRTLNRSTGDMGIVIERATGSILIVEHSKDSILCRVEGLGDLSHASAVYSRDQAFVYIFA